MKPDKWDNPLGKWFEDNLSYAALSKPTEADYFIEIGKELERLEQEGYKVGEELRQVSHETAKLRAKYQEMCGEEDHEFEDGVCVICLQVDDRDFEEMQVDGWIADR